MSSSPRGNRVLPAGVRRLIPAIAIGIGLLLLGLAGVLRAGIRTEVHTNTFVTPSGAAGLIDENNSPALARNPRNQANLVVTNRIDRPRFSASLWWSSDDGGTWTLTSLPLPLGKDRPYAPDIAFAPDGTLYVTYVNLHGRGNDPENLWISVSHDGGRSLSAPVLVAQHLVFQARLAVDAEGAIYITWLQGTEVGNLSMVGEPSPVVLVRSADGGHSFSRPVRVSDASRTRVGAASPVADSDGGIDVLYEDFKGDVRDFQNLEGPPWDKPFALVVARSDDHGRTFAPGVEVDGGLLPAARFLVYLPAFPSLAAGPDGSLYVAWSDARNGDEDVFLRRSADHGRSWSDAVRVNGNPIHDGTSQYLPRVAVAGDGRVDIIFLDRRGDSRNLKTGVYLASSIDHGRSFHETRVSSQTFSSSVGSTVAAYLPVDLGSRIALISNDEGALGAWADTRLGTEDTGRQDIIAARVAISQDSLLLPLLLVGAGALVLLATGGISLRR